MLRLRVPQVFLSSPYEDLRHTRLLIRAELSRLPIAVRGMEEFGSFPMTAKDRSVRLVQECDIYVLVLGMRYGSLDEEKKKSITHWEYKAALEAGLRMLVYVVSDNAVWPIRDVENGVGQETLGEWKYELLKGPTLPYRFKDVRDLPARITRDVEELLQQPFVGENIGRLLRHRREELGLTHKTIAKRAKALSGKLPSKPDWYVSAERGTKKVTLKRTIDLANIYDMDPSVLQALSATKQRERVHLKGKGDFVKCKFVNKNVKGTIHSPAQRLEGSATVIVKVNIDKKKAKSILHHHPGFEVVVVMKGEVLMEFRDKTGDDRFIHLSEGNVLHFSSESKHRFVGLPGQSAELYVIRIMDGCGAIQ